MALGIFSDRDIGYNIVTNPSLPFDWNDKYREIHDFDIIRTTALSQPVGGTYCYRLPSPRKIKEQEVYLLEFAKRYTDTSHFLVIHTAKTRAYDSAIGIYRTGTKHRFTGAEQEILAYLGPVLVSFIETMMLYHHYDLQRVTIDELIASQQVATLIFNDRLRLLDYSVSSDQFIAWIQEQSAPGKPPAAISDWLQQEIAPAGRLIFGKGPWRRRFRVCDIECEAKAIVVETGLHRLVLMIFLTPHSRCLNFAGLSSAGLTMREIEALSYLPLGYSNRQIASAMAIEEVTVKKHLRNCASKLEAAGRTETLFRAIERLRDIKN